MLKVEFRRLFDYSLIEKAKKGTEIELSFAGIEAINIGVMHDLLRLYEAQPTIQVTHMSSFIRLQIMNGQEEVAQTLRKKMRLRKTKQEMEREQFLYGDTEEKEEETTAPKGSQTLPTTKSTFATSIPKKEQNEAVGALQETPTRNIQDEEEEHHNQESTKQLSLF